jgi:hypothetical protein
MTTAVADTPFESIESAHEYVHLLGESLEESRATIRADIAALAGTRGVERRVDALRLVDYKLTQLRGHVTATGRLLNDLRTLRRLLLRERDETQDADGGG